MKVLRITVTTIFVISCISYFLLQRAIKAKEDYTYPQIKCDNELLEVKIDEKDLLFKGITAFDEKDGDLTDQVVIESISRFFEKGVCNITYAVSDRNNNVTKYTRKIKYTDYVSPRFTFYDEPMLYLGSYINLNELIGAICVIDGDISDKIKYDYGNLDTQTTGVYPVNAYVTNSKGDVSNLVFDLYVRERNLKTPIITLNKYIHYAKIGDQVDPREFIADAIKSDGITKLDLSSINITTDLNKDLPGVYQIKYNIEDENISYTVSMVCIIEE